ncbi:hypothetical protein VTN00DRAFT_7919 [Thermoascus crustaceus]|uniref:uncharacterized protein n=1 Tax=Thermoascus crustaceus TaxID=5088 RepID=UPI003742ECA4
MSRYDRPRPRRRCPKSVTDGSGRFTKLSLLVLISLILMLCPPVVASDAPDSIDVSSWTEQSSSFTERRREIIVDRGESPPQPRVDVEGIQLDSDNHPSDDHGDDHHGSFLYTKTSRPPAIPIKRSSTSDTSAMSSSVTTSIEPFPTPLDGAGLGDKRNFTSENCPSFLYNNIRNDATISSCHAISLLMQNSNSFFSTLKSRTSLTQVLDTACSSPMSLCTDVLSDRASQLIKKDACGEDYKLGNPIVTEVYDALIAYQPLFQATCLKDPSTNDYCYVQAAGPNSTKIDDSYVYYLPLATPFPGSSRPTCNQCLQSTMEIFADAAQTKGQPLTKTYIPAAQQINIACGPNFASTAIDVGSKKPISAGSLTGRGRPDMELMGYVLMLSLAATVLGIL